jgi:putative redox protein
MAVRFLLEPAEFVTISSSESSCSVQRSSSEKQLKGERYMANEIKVALRQVSASTTEAVMGKHHVLIDRPEAKGGTDSGPMGGQLFLGAIGGCFMSNLLAAMKARNTEVANVHTEVTGTVVDSPPRFVAIDLHVTAEGGDPAQLQHLVQIADRGCIMMNTLRDKLDVKLRIGAAEASVKK